MARNLDPKCKQCRRAGEKLFLKGERCNSPKCALVKRNYPPGLHGLKGKKRLSDYGLRLQEKQKAKRQYLLLEKQFKLSFDQAHRQIGDTGENLLKILESRLDNVIYRLRLSPSRNQARQLVNHGHFTVNGRKVDIPSSRVKTGDIIAIKKSSQQKLFASAEAKIKTDEIPGWLNFDIKEMSAKVLHSPGAEEIRNNINTQMIVEYYSR